MAIHSRQYNYTGLDAPDDLTATKKAFPEKVQIFDVDDRTDRQSSKEDRISDVRWTSTAEGDFVQAESATDSTPVCFGAVVTSQLRKAGLFALAEGSKLEQNL